MVMRRTIGCIQTIFGGAPFVNKNVKHLLRLAPLAKVFKNAHFLVVERALEDVALSVLRARHESAGGAQNWWSAKPSNFLELKNLPIPEQIAGQLISLKQQLYRDLEALESQHSTIINYEHFCSDPESIVEESRGKIKGLSCRGPAERKFTQSVNSAETPTERQLVRVLSKLLQDEGVLQNLSVPLGTHDPCRGS